MLIFNTLFVGAMGTILREKVRKGYMAFLFQTSSQKMGTVRNKKLTNGLSTNTF